MKLSIVDTKAKLAVVSGVGNITRAGNLYKSHDLYKSHQLYYGPHNDSDFKVKLSSVANQIPKLLSVKEIYE